MCIKLFTTHYPSGSKYTWLLDLDQHVILSTVIILIHSQENTFCHPRDSIVWKGINIRWLAPRDNGDPRFRGDDALLFYRGVTVFWNIRDSIIMDNK
jgi:hypothetical protein